MKKLGSRLVSRTLHRDKDSNDVRRVREAGSPDSSISSSSFVNVEFETARPASRVLRAPAQPPITAKHVQEEDEIVSHASTSKSVANDKRASHGSIMASEQQPVESIRHRAVDNGRNDLMSSTSSQAMEIRSPPTPKHGSSVVTSSAGITRTLKHRASTSSLSLSGSTSSVGSATPVNNGLSGSRTLKHRTSTSSLALSSASGASAAVAPTSRVRTTSIVSPAAMSGIVPPRTRTTSTASVSALPTPSLSGRSLASNRTVAAKSPSGNDVSFSAGNSSISQASGRQRTTSVLSPRLPPSSAANTSISGVGSLRGQVRSVKSSATGSGVDKGNMSVTSASSRLPKTSSSASTSTLNGFSGTLPRKLGSIRANTSLVDASSAGDSPNETSRVEATPRPGSHATSMRSRHLVASSRSENQKTPMPSAAHTSNLADLEESPGLNDLVANTTVQMRDTAELQEMLLSPLATSLSKGVANGRKESWLPEPPSRKEANEEEEELASPSKPILPANGFIRNKAGSAVPTSASGTKRMSKLAVPSSSSIASMRAGSKTPSSSSAASSTSSRPPSSNTSPSLNGDGLPALSGVLASSKSSGMKRSPQQKSLQLQQISDVHIKRSRRETRESEGLEALYDTHVGDGGDEADTRNLLGDASTSMMRADLLAVSLTPARPASSSSTRPEVAQSTEAHSAAIVDLQAKLSELQESNAALLAERAAKKAEQILLSLAVTERDAQIAQLRSLLSSSSASAIELATLRAKATERSTAHADLERIKRRMAIQTSEIETEKKERALRVARENWEALERENEQERQIVQGQRELMQLLGEMMQHIKHRVQEQAALQDTETLKGDNVALIA